MDFILLINKKSMDSFHEEKEDETVNLIIKAVDLLMHKNVFKYITPI